MPSAPDLDQEYDSGSSWDDNITNKTSVLVSGTGPASTTIRIYNGTEYTTTSTDTNGDWSVMVDLTENTTNVLKTASVSFSGAMSDYSDSLSIICDTIGPTVTYTTGPARHFTRDVTYPSTYSDTTWGEQVAFDFNGSTLGETFEAEVVAPLNKNSYLKVVSAAGTVWYVKDDDSGIGAAAKLSTTLVGGKAYNIHVRNYSGTELTTYEVAISINADPWDNRRKDEIYSTNTRIIPTITDTGGSGLNSSYYGVDETSWQAISSGGVFFKSYWTSYDYDILANDHAGNFTITDID